MLIYIAARGWRDSAQFTIAPTELVVVLKRIVALGALVSAIVLVVNIVGIAPKVQAAGLTVNSTTDAVDMTPGDGSCATSTGVCTLRAAIMEANAQGGAHTVTLPTGTYSILIAPQVPSAMQWETSMSSTQKSQL
jgi:CSLREA domain-containing protein